MALSTVPGPFRTQPLRLSSHALRYATCGDFPAIQLKTITGDSCWQQSREFPDHDVRTIACRLHRRGRFHLAVSDRQDWVRKYSNCSKLPPYFAVVRLLTQKGAETHYPQLI